MIFGNNTATNSGPNLYGGLFDRCILSAFTEVYKMNTSIRYYSGVAYLRNISNIVLDSVSSLPVRVMVKDSQIAATSDQPSSCERSNLQCVTSCSGSGQPLCQC